MSSRRVLLLLFGCSLSLAACRKQTQPVDVPAGPNGVGTGYTAACNGDFPSWIVSVAPVDTGGGDFNSHEPGVQKPFELAQSYPLGIPVFTGSPPVLNHYDPPSPNTDAPWRAYTNLADPTQRTNYLNALKSYLLQNMSDPSISFDATANNKILANRRWFHVPMMTAAGPKRREPYHGVTSERALRQSEQGHWINTLNSNANLRATAIGYYNFLGGYTIGQVFPSSDLTQTNAAKATFIDGAMVFKLLFAEYDPTRMIAPDALANSPEWWVQDLSSTTGAQIRMRLLQVDVAVKDDHFPNAGWVFGTFAYDERLTSTEPNPWKRLTPIGIMWGNDPTVTVNPAQTAMPPYPASGQSWINRAGMPPQFLDHVGRAGRLIGPVDDPQSSCLSCHSTAEVDPSVPGNGPAYSGAAFKPPSGCADPADTMVWFRNLHGGTAFGHGITCPPITSPTGLVSMDYSLQLSEGVASVFGYQNSNPCVGVMGPPQAARRPPPAPGAEGNAKFHFRELAPQVSSLKVTEDKAAKKQYVGPAPDEANQR